MRRHTALVARVSAIVVAVAVIMTVLVAGLNYITIGRPKRDMVAGAKAGMRRSDVIRRLGPPQHIARSLNDLRNVSSFVPRPTAPVEKEILEYYRGHTWKLYVYVDRSDHVTRVMLAKT